MPPFLQYCGFLQYVRLTGDSKLSVCVSPVIDWRPGQEVQGVPHLPSAVSWDKLQLLHDHKLDKRLRKWMARWKHFFPDNSSHVKNSNSPTQENTVSQGSLNGFTLWLLQSPRPNLVNNHEQVYQTVLSTTIIKNPNKGISFEKVMFHALAPTLIKTL